ncbi:MAG: polyprenyl synthetase family protein, partial [Vallitaleaceae bacterium]|nr:polyprenyl synthetase family protein [Vallitaleaceae bacterium]
MLKLSEFQKQMNQWIEESLPKTRSKNHQKVMEAMEYSIRNGGKRIRPLLMYAAYSLFSKEMAEEDIKPFLAAIEMIHSYSLVHDDLPAMDDDELRRGKPTCHVVYGEANAILAGDGLLNYAYESLSQKAYETLLIHQEKGIRMVRALAVLGKAAGIYGMIGGQAADMLFENASDCSLEDLSYIHQHKT